MKLSFTVHCFSTRKVKMTSSKTVVQLSVCVGLVGITPIKTGGFLTLPTIMWLQTSQNVGFLKMCSMKQCPAESTCSGLRDCEREVGGGAQGMAGGTGGMGRLTVCGGAIPMLQRWLVLPLTSDSSSVLLSLLLRKKLSALLLRMLLVLKDRERLSLCSWNQKEWVEKELGKTV